MQKNSIDYLRGWHAGFSEGFNEATRIMKSQSAPDVAPASPRDARRAPEALAEGGKLYTNFETLEGDPGDEQPQKDTTYSPDFRGTWTLENGDIVTIVGRNGLGYWTNAAGGIGWGDSGLCIGIPKWNLKERHREGARHR